MALSPGEFDALIAASPPAAVLPDTSLFSRPRDGSQPYSLLVVDDDPAIRRIMAAALQQAGYQVMTAADGDVAFDVLTRLAQNRRPLDAMLLDVHMPGISGFDLLDRMLQAGMVLPVIGVTGDQERATVIDLMRRGVGELIDKPVQIDLLVTTVRGFLERNELLGERRRARERKLKAEMEELERSRADDQRKARDASDSYSRLEAQMQSARSVWQDITGVLAAPHGVSLAWRTRPLSDLGGDFIALRATDRGCLLLVADVAGHDMGASLHGVLIKAFFEENCRSGLAGEEFLARLNRQLVQSTAQRRLVTAQLIDIDLLKEQATVVSAGHPAVLHQRGAVLTRVAGEGGVLGIVDDIGFAPRTIDLRAGDRLFVCTDGVTDLPRIDGRTGTRERYGIDGLTRDLLAGANAPIEAQVEGAWTAITAFCRKKQVDDMVLVGLGYVPDDDGYAPADTSSPSPVRPSQG